MRNFRHLLPVLFAFLMLGLPLPSRAAVEVAITATIAPPVLPVYAQPVIPGDGYIWMPGYWAWGPSGYYWVPGTWVMPPQVGLLWTPGYWAWRDNVYVWNAGYWGPHVGFYGGVNYGFGYIGVGYVGGFWDHDHFHYNAAVNNFGGTHITNVYRQTVVNNVTRVSFNGGHGGTTAQPNAEEEAAAHDPHIPPTTLQARHQQMASSNHALLASVNHGRPAIAATPRPAAFTVHGTVAARGVKAGPGHAAPNVHHAAAANAPHPPHHPPAQHPTHKANAHPGPAPHNPGQPKPPQQHEQRPPDDQHPDDHH